MTLDEAIEREEARIKYMGVFIPCDGCMINDCKEYRKQLAEWLKELKAYRIATYKLARMPYGEHLTYKADDVWELFEDLYADSIEQEIMDYEEVKADADSCDD